MASITSLTSSSSTSSIYGNRNVLSGLASGMDTEAMIENAVSGIKLKIQSLQKRQTKLQWQQEAYRSIIDKAVNFNQKYTSYTSSTNLLSSSFFNKAVITTAKSSNAENASKVSASGKTSSDVQILGVKQLATSATYRTTGLAGMTDSFVSADEAIDLEEKLPQSNLTGLLTLKYGANRTIDLSFDELETYGSVDALASGIKKKLEEISVSTSTGESKKASEMVNVEVKDGNIVFSDAQDAGNSVVVSSASGKIKDTLNINASEKSDTLTVGDAKLINRDATVGEYLGGKEMSVTLDGVTKKIKVPEYKEGDSAQSYLSSLQKSLDKAFGKGKITTEGSTVGDSTLTLDLSPVQEGTTLSVSGAAAKVLGMSDNGKSNYLDTGKKLGDLLGSSFNWGKMDTLAAEGEVKEVKDKNGKITHYVDSKGNRVKNTSEGWMQVDSEGDYLYDCKVNGVSVGKFSKNSALESVTAAINSSGAGVKASYSKITNEFLFTTTETGANSKIEFDGLAKELFGSTTQPFDTTRRIGDVLGENYKFDGADGDFTLKLDNGTNTFRLSVDVNGDSTVNSILREINGILAQSSSFSDVKASFDGTTNSLVLTDKDGEPVKFSQEGVAGDLFDKISSGDLSDDFFLDTSKPYDTSKTLSDILGEGFNYGDTTDNFNIKLNNGKNTFKLSIGVDGDSSIDSILESLNATLSNSSTFGNVKASFDDSTNSLVFRDENGKTVSYTKGGVAEDVFDLLEKPASGQFSSGQDAVLSMSVNGKVLDGVTRSNNTFDIDGLSVTLKDTFGEYGERDEDGNVTEDTNSLSNLEEAKKNAVVFETVSDADKIVDAIKSMVDDYNELVSEIKSSYSTQPATKSDKSRYEPLTSEQMADMSDKEIEQYEELAKQGILFGDSDLSSMYSKLLNCVAPGGADGQTLREIGITTSYSDGLTTLSLDEEKLRDTLSNDPDKVRRAFTKTSEDGSGNGLMQSMQNTLNTYVKTTGEPKGVLITKAGSAKAPTSLNSNSLLTQINNLDSQIERWQDKMYDQIDRYTTQFTRLEQLIAEMNSQASAMSGLMGGSSY